MADTRRAGAATEPATSLLGLASAALPGAPELGTRLLASAFELLNNTVPPNEKECTALIHASSELTVCLLAVTAATVFDPYISAEAKAAIQKMERRGFDYRTNEILKKDFMEVQVLPRLAKGSLVQSKYAFEVRQMEAPLVVALHQLDARFPAPPHAKSWDGDNVDAFFVSVNKMPVHLQPFFHGLYHHRFALEKGDIAKAAEYFCQAVENEMRKPAFTGAAHDCFIKLALFELEQLCLLDNATSLRVTPYTRKPLPYRYFAKALALAATDALNGNLVGVALHHSTKSLAIELLNGTLTPEKERELCSNILELTQRVIKRIDEAKSDFGDFSELFEALCHMRVPHILPLVGKLMHQRRCGIDRICTLVRESFANAQAPDRMIPASQQVLDEAKKLHREVREATLESLIAEMEAQLNQHKKTNAKETLDQVINTLTNPGNVMQVQYQQALDDLFMLCDFTNASPDTKALNARFRFATEVCSLDEFKHRFSRLVRMAQSKKEQDILKKCIDAKLEGGLLPEIGERLKLTLKKFDEQDDLPPAYTPPSAPSLYPQVDAPAPAPAPSAPLADIRPAPASHVLAALSVFADEMGPMKAKVAEAVSRLIHTSLTGAADPVILATLMLNLKRMAQAEADEALDQSAHNLWNFRC